MTLTVLVYVALALLVLCAAETWVFVARHARTRWWENAEGRYLMRSKIALALMFTMTLLFQVVHPKPITAVLVSILLFAFTAYALADLLVLQTRAKREAKRLPRVPR